MYENVNKEDMMGIIMSNIRNLNQIVERTPFQELIDEISKMNILMPIIDPTGYKGIMDQLPTIEKIAKKYLEVQDLIKEIKSKTPS